MKLMKHREIEKCSYFLQLSGFSDTESLRSEGVKIIGAFTDVALQMLAI